MGRGLRIRFQTSPFGSIPLEEICNLPVLREDLRVANIVRGRFGSVADFDDRLLSAKSGA